MTDEHVWKDAWKKPIKIQFREVHNGELIKTREGSLFAYPDKDYIIRGVEGEEYPIKKEIFEKTYTLQDDVGLMYIEIKRYQDTITTYWNLVEVNVRKAQQLQGKLNIKIKENDALKKARK